MRHLLEQAARWRLLGLLFESPNQEWRRHVAALSSSVQDSLLRQAGELALSQASEGLYHSIFGPGGPASAREVSYRDSLQPGYLLSELAACYAAFGYRPQTPELPDHVAVEAGFLSYLRLKEAYAEFRGDQEGAAVAAQAAGRFAKEHLAVLAAPLTRILAASGIPYLAAAARALARAGLPAGR